jgi:hypothetical protein
MDDENRSPVGYVVVVAEHPIVGRIFWTYFDESEVNAPHYYGLTTDPKSAAWIPAGWRDDRNLFGGRGYRDLDAWDGHNFRNTLLDEFRLESEYRTDVDDEGQLTEHLSGGLVQLHLQSGQSEEDFVRWIWTAEWSDEPAVCRAE